LKRLDFALLLAWAFLSVLAYVTLLFSLSSYCVAIGLTQQQGSLASALLSLGQAFGRPAVGLLSDHFGRIFISMIASFLAGLLSLVVWIFASSAGLTYFFAIIVGLFAGTLWASAAPLAAEVVGIQHLGAALGVIWFVLTPPAAVAEAIALQLRNEVGSSKPYLRVQLFAGFVYIGSAACLAWLLVEVRRKRRVARLGTDKSGL
jgi:MFS family permease